MIFEPIKYYSHKDYGVDFLMPDKSLSECDFSIGYVENKKYTFSEEEGYSEERIKKDLIDFRETKFSELIKNKSNHFFYNFKEINNLNGEIFYFKHNALICFVFEDINYYTLDNVIDYSNSNKTFNETVKKENVINYQDFFLKYYSKYGYFDFDNYIKKWKNTFDLKYLPFFFYEEYKLIKDIDSKLFKRALYVENKLSNTFINTKEKGLLKLKYEGLSKVTGRMFCKNEDFYIQGFNADDFKKNILPINKGDKILEFDFSAFEYRILYKILGIDFEGCPHEVTALNLLGNKLKRDEAKVLNFRILYGANLDLIKQGLNDEQIKFLNTNLVEPKVDLEIKLQKEYKVNGYIRNYFGRIILVQKENALLSNYISSTATDILIYKMVLIYKLFKDKKSIIITQKFDSVFINFNSNEFFLIKDVIDIMKDKYKIFDFKIKINEY